MHQILRQYAVLALSIVGSATLLFSCSKANVATEYDYETLMTESSENRTITMMENGRRSYAFATPLMEGYSMATNPYQEFRRGIHMTTYTQDSLNLIDATITANYAIYYENQRLWEAKGNVIIIKNNRQEGDTTVTGHTEIYTQQLFWNATTKKIYSNVDTKILQPDGWHFGVGFDADEDLKNIHFRKYSSEMEFDMSQPTPEELEEENQKREEEAKKGGNESKRDNASTGGSKPKSGSQTVKPQAERQTPPQSVGAGVTRPTPTTVGASRQDQKDADNKPKMTQPSNGHVTRPQQLQHQTLSTSTDLSTMGSIDVKAGEMPQGGVHSVGTRGVEPPASKK